MVELNDLIKIYPDSLSKDICNYLITFFDSNESIHEKITNDKKPNFTQLDLSECASKNSELESVHNFLVHTTIQYKNEYYSFIDSRCFPEDNAFEHFRIKRYLNNGDDAFDTHVDVKDLSTCKRYLSFMWYLNDVESGGNTVFYDYKIQPKAGTLVVFPPMWMYPHKGEEPISGSKYIMSTYLHYV